MKLLGVRICEHDANFTLYDNGSVSYYKPERFHQEKHKAFSIQDWEEELTRAWNITSSDLDHIAVAFDPWSHDIPKENETFFPAIDYKKFPANCKVTRVNHHYAHALSCWPMDITPDVSIVIDGYGDDDKAWTVFKNDKLVEEGSKDKNGSIGLRMSWLARELGVQAHHEIDLAGKLMGLQSYGNVDAGYKQLLSKWDIYNIDEIFNLDTWDDYKGGQFLGELTQLDASATIHDYIGDVLVKFFEQHCNKDDVIFYSGGVAQNVIWNTKLKKHFPNLVIPPHAADEGLSLGCIEWLRREYNLPPLSLNNFPYCQLDNNEWKPISGNTIADVALALAEGKIVGWFHGQGEIGPRALGNRSILFNPMIKDGKNIVNNVKKRESYRPFGASVLSDYKDMYFKDLPDNPHMLYVAEVYAKDYLKSITHVDGTCRVQTVSEEGHFKELLREFFEITGCPILLNTSLNLNGKPIASSPEDAMEIFKWNNIDWLVIGNDVFSR